MLIFAVFPRAGCCRQAPDGALSPLLLLHLHVSAVIPRHSVNAYCEDLFSWWHDLLAGLGLPT